MSETMQSTPERILTQAVAYQQAGMLQQAAEGYATILQSEPNHAVANHNMGVVALLMKQAAACLPYFLAALEADPARGQYWIGYIDALYQTGHWDEARQVLEMARQQGLQGAEVDALATRLNEVVPEVHASDRADASPAPTATQDGLLVEPSSQQVDTLIALFNQGRLNEVISLAQSMTLRFPQHGFGWKVLGAAYKQMGRNADALVPMQKALVLAPGDADVHYNLGLTLLDLGRLQDAESCFRQTILINPDFYQAHSSLGVVLQGLGRLSEALESYRDAIKLAPNYADAHNNLGNLFRELGRQEEACDCYRRALQINPDFALAYSNLGTVQEDIGSLDEAEANFRSALQIAPDFVAAHCSLGNVLKKQGRLSEAEASYRQAIQISPDVAELHFNLANTLIDLDKTFDAEVSYRQAIQIRPDYAEAHYNLGTYLMRSKWVDEAEVSFRNALQYRPDYVEVYSNLGVLLQVVGRMEEGIACQQRVVQLKPNCADALNDLGNVQRDSGRHDDAKISYRRALELDPGHATAHSNLIFALDLVADISIEEMQEERRKWGEMHAEHLLQAIEHANSPDPERRLRVGYVATDFRTNSAPTVYGAMLFEYDRSRFDVFAYSNETKATDLTERFKQNVTGWRDIFDMSDDEVENLIREDQIDILVDLAGHSGRNRLPVFARKPAPIQITAWGYSTGTGIKAIDVLFSDPVLIPPEEKSLYAEQVRYLPIFFSYYPCQTPPEVGTLPALTNGYITFGTFTRMEKVTDETYQAWASVLLAVPDSRMLFKNHEMKHAEARARVTERFTRFGVAPERLLFMEWTPWEAHMDAFNRVDIALDTFPQGGGVTTLEGILMGVPLITLSWPTFAGRTGKSILNALGLSDWIAETPEQYVAIAKQKARDIDALAKLRGELRSRLRSSILGNTQAYVSIVEQEYRHLWREWCDSRSSSS